MAKNQFLTGKKFKTAKNAISRKFIYLFDFASVFAWTFLSFLARWSLQHWSSDLQQQAFVGFAAQQQQALVSKQASKKASKVKL